MTPGGAMHACFIVLESSKIEKNYFLLQRLTSEVDHMSSIEQVRNVSSPRSSKLTSAPILTLPNSNKVFELECDACKFRINVRLTYEQDLYSVYSYFIWALKHWKQYLIPKVFVIFLNHKSMKYFRNQRNLNKLYVRWASWNKDIVF